MGSMEKKHLFIAEKVKGKFPKQIFEECGLNIEIVSIHRIASASKRWSKAFNESGISGLRNTRAENSGRVKIFFRFFEVGLTAILIITIGDFLSSGTTL